MNQLFILILIFIGALIIRRFRVLPDNTAKGINHFIIYISLPAVILLNLRNISWSLEMLFPILMPWIFFFLAALVFWNLGRLLNWNRATTGCLILLAGLGNTSFIGFPMIEAYWGKEAISIGLLVDQGGSFFVVSTLGIWTVMFFSGEKFQPKIVLRRILTFPPFLAMILAALLLPIAYPHWVESSLNFLSNLLAPLAMFSIGFQLKLGAIKTKWKILSIGLAFKMFLAPMLLYLIYAYGLGLTGMTLNITIFEAAMPPMVTAGILASERNLDTELASLMVSVGIILDKGL